MKFALIIGNERYTDAKLARLKAPVADVRALATVLSDQSIGFFDNVIPLINKTESQVSRAISNFFTNKKPEDLVLVYFSGHGVLDGRGRLFLALKDTQTSLLKSTAIPAAFISDEMDSCRSRRQILILDCCNSGAFERGAKGEQKAVTEATFEGNGFGRVVLTASDSTQFALEGEQIIQTELSLFTHFLLAGLRTGEADLDNDGYVSLDEWYDYTYTQVLATTPKQNPNKWSYRQQGDLIIAKNPSWKKKVAGLPTKLSDLLESPYPSAREAAVRELGVLLRSSDSHLAELARQALENLKDDESGTVSLAVEKVFLEAEREITEQVERERAEKASQEKLERDATEKARKEKAEREAAEKTAREKAKRDAAEKAKREKAERRAAQIAGLKETIAESFTALKSALPKALPFLRIVGLAGIVIALLLGGSLAIPQFIALIPTARNSVIPPTNTKIAITKTPVPPTKTLRPNATSTKTRIPSPTATLRVGSTMIDEDGMTLLYVPAGNFQMGRDLSMNYPDQYPAHTVYLDAFWIDKTEVTNKMYALCVTAGVCKPPAYTNSSTRSIYYGDPQYDNYPVIFVDWNRAKSYCEWAGRQLPTEAQWEKAAGGTDDRYYSWGNEVPADPNQKFLNFYNIIGDTTEVGTYPGGASPYGALDMAGNVWEWMADWYDSTYYVSSPASNPLGPTSGQYRVLRGEAWNTISYPVPETRNRYASTGVKDTIGFRCVKSANP